jgi:hypothetical protein
MLQQGSACSAPHQVVIRPLLLLLLLLLLMAILPCAAAGAVDFALIFVANYGLPKKYTDPGDASHAVDMLLEVLGKVSQPAFSATLLTATTT